MQVCEIFCVRYWSVNKERCLDITEFMCRIFSGRAAGMVDDGRTGLNERICPMEIGKLAKVFGRVPVLGC